MSRYQYSSDVLVSGCFRANSFRRFRAIICTGYSYAINFWAYAIGGLSPIEFSVQCFILLADSKILVVYFRKIDVELIFVQQFRQ